MEQITSHPAALGLTPNSPEFFQRKKIINAAKVFQRPWLEESGQWLENVDQTHLVLYNGKVVLKKKESLLKHPILAWL